MLVQLSVDDLHVLIVESVAEALGGSLPGAERPREVLTRKEASDFLRCSVATLDRLVRESGLPSYRLGDSPRFRRSDLLAYLSAPRLMEAAE